MIPHHSQRFLFMLEIPFETGLCGLRLIIGVSTGEEGGYGEGCVVKNGRVHGVVDHVYSDGLSELCEPSIGGEAVHKVMDVGNVPVFEARAVGKEPFWY